MEEMGTMNEAFVAVGPYSATSWFAAKSQFLPEGPKPARTCVQVGKLPGGPNASIEIEAIAQV
jgi:enamine deaminase RidA (YjgF/YER057c/UK114 family)